jgi:hypothetical protein
MMNASKIDALCRSNCRFARALNPNRSLEREAFACSFDTFRFLLALVATSNVAKHGLLSDA